MSEMQLKDVVQWVDKNRLAFYGETGRWCRVSAIAEATKSEGCYALVHHGRVLYLGQTGNIRERLSRHGWKIQELGVSTKWGFFEGAQIKARADRKDGEHLALEWRLLRRLRPEFNSIVPGVSRKVHGRIRERRDGNASIEPVPSDQSASSCLVIAQQFGITEQDVRQILAGTVLQLFLFAATKAKE